MRNWILSLTFLTIAFYSGAAPTSVTVRAVSRDAKVIGDGVGGARITIRDLRDGKVLATGLQTGGTGDTRKIMQEARSRNASVYGTEGAAAFRATLDLTAPTVVEITAEGPLKYPQAVQRVSKTMLLAPGRNIDGDGILLEIPGFIVDAPASVQARTGSSSDLRARVTMTCGCPTEPGGMWDADRITVTATVMRDGKSLNEVPMKFAGITSTFAATMPALPAGTYMVEILAVDQVTENAGRTVVTLHVTD